MSSQQDVAKLRVFLRRAESDSDEVRKGYFGKHSPEPDIAELDRAFQQARQKAGIDLPHDKPWEPSKRLCTELGKMMDDWLNAYGPPGSPPFDQIYVAVRFAMPLVSTVESEDGAAG